MSAASIYDAPYTNLNNSHDPTYLGTNTTFETPLGSIPVAQPTPAAKSAIPDYVADGFSNFYNEYFVYHGYLSAVVCAFGIPANMANIVVLTRKNMISSTNWILTWLAVADLFTMCSYLPGSFHFYIFKDPNLNFPESWSIHWIRFLFFHSNFSVWSHTVTIWLTIALAIFRYIYVCYPTQGSTLCTIARAKFAIFSVYISTVIICIPNVMSYSVIKHGLRNATYKYANGSSYTIAKTAYTIGKSPFASEHPAVEAVNTYTQALLVKLIPCVALSILTTLLLMAMRKANARRMQLKSQGRTEDSNRAREHNRTTGMLLAVVVLFLITEAPQGILVILNYCITGFFEYIYMPLGDVLDMMALLNNGINFVLYCTMSRQFRDTFVKQFCRCCPERRPGWLKLRTFEHKNGALIAMKPLNSHQVENACDNMNTCTTNTKAAVSRHASTDSSQR